MIVGVVAYSSPEQAKAASIAAFSQAESDYTGSIIKNNKLTGAEPSVENLNQYLERLERYTGPAAAISSGIHALEEARVTIENSALGTSSIAVP